MPERLTVQLEDGCVARLREMAGGERKVGAFLSMVTAWLYAQREHMDMANLFDYVIPETSEGIAKKEAELERLVDERLAGAGGTIERAEALYNLLEEQYNRVMQLMREAFKLDADGVEKIIMEAHEQGLVEKLNALEETYEQAEEAKDERKRQQPQGRQE